MHIQDEMTRPAGIKKQNHYHASSHCHIFQEPDENFQ